MATPAANPPAPSPAPKLVSSSVEGGFDIRFSWTLDFNILEPPEDTEPDTTLEILVSHDDLKFQRISSSATVELSLHWIRGTEHGRIAFINWEDEPVPDKPADETVYMSYRLDLTSSDIQDVVTETHGVYDPALHRCYRFDFTIRQTDSSPSRDAADLVERMPDLSLDPHPNVRLFFPRFGEDGAELWTTRALLENSSSYLETLLESDFVESIAIGSKRPRVERGDFAPAVADSDAKDFEDSDDETDAILLEQEPPNITDISDAFSYNQITVTKTAYSTYRAVLVFLQTRFIRFAPLSSACKPIDPTAHSSRREKLAAIVKSSWAVPVSPKSAYRLAHLLEVQDLQRYCLHALRKGLTVAGAAHELFSDVSACYDAWRAVILEYVVENWDDVSKAPSWIEAMAQVKAGDKPEAASIIYELMEARVKRLSG
ncbi:hypothetical protein JCM10449v2_004908 [Rhodotorula kratochvilovae]